VIGRDNTIHMNQGDTVKIPTRQEDVESLFKTIRELVPERDLDKLLERVIQVSTQILGTDRALLFLFDKKRETLEFKYGINVEKDLIEKAHQFSSSVIERAMKGEIIMTTDSEGDQKFSPTESMIRYDIRTVLCAPILTEGNLVGVIYSDTRGRKTLLDEEGKNYFLSFVDLIADVIVRAMDLHEKEDELTYLKKRLTEETILSEIAGHSSSIMSVKEKVMRMASVDYPVSVLIVGESGAGKEMIARAIHQVGSRSDKPYVVVNCAAITASLMESELFGHEKGAFTGAHSRKQGFFEAADGGVIFLDEIGDLSTELQPKILRVLQFGTFTRVGGRKELSVDVQVLCATSKDLYSEMEEGRFRKELFHRLAVQVVRVPPLRDRKQDILLLANYFMRSLSEKMGKTITGIDIGAQKLLTRHDYTENNVRELKNIIERAMLNAEGNKITASDIVFSDDLLFGTSGQKITPEAGETDGEELININENLVAKLFMETGEGNELEKKDMPYYKVHDEMEKKLILLALRQSDWKIKPAAKLLGISHLNLRTKLGPMIGDFLKGVGGDMNKVAQKYSIPPKFLKAKQYLLSTKS